VAPMAGGLAASFVLELLVYPALYFWWRERGTKSQENLELYAVAEQS